MQYSLDPAAACIEALIETEREDDEAQEVRRGVGVRLLTEAVGRLIRGG